ncbi:hypothetical protein JCM14720_15670 [Calditerricola yamamurae]|jgi:hypothetical protein
MAILPQGSLFSWNEIAGLGDLERLKLVLEHLPDEALMQKLEKARGKGRDDYPVRAMWNAYIALVVFQHPRRIPATRTEPKRAVALAFGLWRPRAKCRGLQSLLETG